MPVSHRINIAQSRILSSSSLRRDDKFIVLQATCALPLLFPVFDLDGKLCMDGGVAAQQRVTHPAEKNGPQGSALQNNSSFH